MPAARLCAPRGTPREAAEIGAGSRRTGSPRPVRAPPPPRRSGSGSAPAAPAPRPRSFQSCPRPHPDHKRKRAESSSPRRFRGRTRTATFTLVSDMLAALARPQAALHARRRRRRSRAPPERGRRRRCSAVCSVRQRRGARAIPGERDAGHGRGPGRGGRAGGRAGRGAAAAAAAGGEEAAPPGPRRRSSRAGPADRRAPRLLAAAPGPAAPPSSAPRRARAPAPRGGPARRRAAPSGTRRGRRAARCWGPLQSGAGRPVSLGPACTRAGGDPTSTALNSSHLVGPLSPQPQSSWACRVGRPYPRNEIRLNLNAGTPPPPPARHCTERAAAFSDACGEPRLEINLCLCHRKSVCLQRLLSLPSPARALFLRESCQVGWRVIHSYIRI